MIPILFIDCLLMTNVKAPVEPVVTLLPGAQGSANVINQGVYPRLQAFILHALMQVAWRSEDDPTFFAPLYRTLDTSNTAIMVGGVGP